MRTPLGRIDPGLIEQLADQPQRFEFFQAVRVLERHLAQQVGSLPSARDPVSEQVRFGNSLALAFAPSQIEALQFTHAAPEAAPASNPQKGDGAADITGARLTPAFIGLLGLHGTLPAHYTETVDERIRYHRDRGVLGFMDLFSNRAVGHFYRAWKKYRLPMVYESDRVNAFISPVLALSGLGFSSLRNRLNEAPGRVDDESMAYFAALLRQRPVSARSLEKILSQYFRVPVQVEQFIGKWYQLPSDQRSTLGGKNASLGKTMMVGERMWQRNLRVRLRIGPLPKAQYLAFLPGSELAGALAKLLSLATSYQYEYEVRPVLRAADVTPAALGGPSGGARLGYDTFVTSRAVQADRDDTVYELHAA